MTELEAVIEALIILGKESHYLDVTKLVVRLKPDLVTKTPDRSVSRVFSNHAIYKGTIPPKKAYFYSNKSGIYGLIE